MRGALDLAGPWALRSEGDLRALLERIEAQLEAARAGSLSGPALDLAPALAIEVAEEQLACFD